ncbi:MAG: VIT1/CCC1 transporter family protein [Patescibacteria group bacterium]
MTNAAERERHMRTGRHIKDVVYAANDGIVTTFAVVAATVGGSLSPLTILIVGIANLFADGFSMASGDYLGSKSEADFYAKEEAEEYREIRERPDDERQEIRDILEQKGYAGADLDEMTRLVCANDTMWVDLMMHDELGMQKPGGDSSLQSAMRTFCSFVIAGSIPLLPYIFMGTGALFGIAVTGTAGALFIIGALRSFFSQSSWIFCGCEMLVIGGSAAALSYGIGALLAALMG